MWVAPSWAETIFPIMWKTWGLQIKVMESPFLSEIVCKVANTKWFWKENCGGKVHDSYLFPSLFPYFSSWCWWSWRWCWWWCASQSYRGSCRCAPAWWFTIGEVWLPQPLHYLVAKPCFSIYLNTIYQLYKKLVVLSCVKNSSAVTSSFSSSPTHLCFSKQNVNGQKAHLEQQKSGI